MLRRLLFVVLGLVALGLVATWIARTSFDLNGGALARALSGALDADVNIAGRVRVRVFPGLQLTTGNVTLVSRPEAPTPYQARIGRVGLDLRLWRLLVGVLHIEDMELRDVEVLLRADVANDPELPTAEPADFGLGLFVRRAEYENINLTYQAGTSGSPWTLHLEHARLEEDQTLMFFEAQGAIQDADFDLAGEIGSIEQLGRNEPFPFRMSGSMLDAEVEAEGTWRHPHEMRGLDAEVRARIPDLASLMPTSDDRAPALGHVELAGRVRDPNGVLGVDELRIVCDDPNFQAEFRGAVRDLWGTQGIELDFEIDAANSRLFDALTDWPLPPVDRLQMSGHLSDADGSLGLQGQLTAQRAEGNLSIELVGGDDDLAGNTGLDLQAQIRGASTLVLGPLFDLTAPLPAAGPVSLSANLREQAGPISAEAIKLDIGERGGTWLEMQGSVQDIASARDVKLDLRFGAADLSALKPWLKRKPPDLGPLEGEATIVDRDGTLGVEGFRLSGGRADTARYQFSGDFDDLLEIDEIALEARLEARDGRALGELLDIDLRSVGPILFDGQIRGSNEKLTTDGLTQLGATLFRGALFTSFGEGIRPRIVGDLTSPHVRLEDLGIAPEPAPIPEQETPESRTRTQGESYVVRTDAIPFDRLGNLDAELGLSIAVLSGREGLYLQQVTTQLSLREGKLRIEAISTEAEGGTVSGEFAVDATRAEPQLKLQARVDHVDLTRLMKQFDEKTESAGKLKMLVDVETSGRTIQELGRGLNGYSDFRLRDGTLASQYARRLVFDLAKVSIPRLVVAKVPRVNCVLGEFDIKNGIAEIRRLILDGQSAEVRGEGSIDLVEGTLDLTLSPRPKDPGLLTVAATVRATGPIGDPQFRPLPATIATSMARTLYENVQRPRRFILGTFSADKVSDLCRLEPEPLATPQQP